MKLTITPQYCTQDSDSQYHHAPIICSKPTHVVLKNMKLLIIDSQPRECAIYTSGGDLHTGGGDLHTGGGDLHTCGGDLDTDGGDLDTGGGDLHTDGGDLHTGGGDLDTGGGPIYTGGGDIHTGGGDLDTDGGDLDTGGGKINGYSSPSLQIQQERLLKVREQILLHPTSFDMRMWHGAKNWDKRKSCETTHCLAGWLQVLSDDKAIHAMLPINAGIILAPIAAPHFFESNEKVLDWLRCI